MYFNLCKTHGAHHVAFPLYKLLPLYGDSIWADNDQRVSGFLFRLQHFFAPHGLYVTLRWGLHPSNDSMFRNGGI